MAETMHIRRNGFTLIELLVVVLILSIVMAVSLPLYLKAVADTKKKTCRANMQTISLAVKTARFKSNSSDYSALIGSVDTTIETDLPMVPVCPSAGAYSIVSTAGGSNFKIVCTASTHGSYEPGVDLY